jgi:hypothetical protein
MLQEMFVKLDKMPVGGALGLKLGTHVRKWFSKVLTVQNVTLLRDFAPNSRKVPLSRLLLKKAPTFSHFRAT